MKSTGVSAKVCNVAFSILIDCHASSRFKPFQCGQSNFELSDDEVASHSVTMFQVANNDLAFSFRKKE